MHILTLQDKDHGKNQFVHHSQNYSHHIFISNVLVHGQRYILGLKREDITSLKHVSPGVRFAVDAYINFAKQRPWQESVCSSLTELFAPHIHQQRISSWPEVYPWINESGLSYFKKRLTEARRDVEQGLSVTLDYFSESRAMQERALDILQFKLNVLWVIADSIMLASSNIKVEDRDYLRQPIF